MPTARGPIVDWIQKMSVMPLARRSRTGVWIGACLLPLIVSGCGKSGSNLETPAPSPRTENPVQSPETAAPLTAVAGESIEVKGRFTLSDPEVEIWKVLVEIVRPRREGEPIIENTASSEITKVGDSEFEYALEIGVPEKIRGDYQIRVTAGTGGFDEKFAAGERPLKVQPRPSDR